MCGRGLRFSRARISQRGGATWLLIMEEAISLPPSDILHCLQQDSELFPQASVFVVTPDHFCHTKEYKSIRKVTYIN